MLPIFGNNPRPVSGLCNTGERSSSTSKRQKTAGGGSSPGRKYQKVRVSLDITEFYVFFLRGSLPEMKYSEVCAHSDWALKDLYKVFSFLPIDLRGMSECIQSFFVPEVFARKSPQSRCASFDWISLIG